MISAPSECVASGDAQQKIALHSPPPQIATSAPLSASPSTTSNMTVARDLLVGEPYRQNNNEHPAVILGLKHVEDTDEIQVKAFIIHIYGGGNDPAAFPTFTAESNLPGVNPGTVVSDYHRPCANLTHTFTPHRNSTNTLHNVHRTAITDYHFVDADSNQFAFRSQSQVYFVERVVTWRYGAPFPHNNAKVSLVLHLSAPLARIAQAY